MKKSERIFNELKKRQLIALLAPKNKEECVSAYELFFASGIILEIALRSEHALDGIKAILEKYPNALVLAGTVMTRLQAEDAIKAGAAGVVSADYIPAVVDACVENNVMCIPGGLADVGKQLVRKAEKYGCSLEDLRQKFPYQWIYKLFPAFSGQLSQMDLAPLWKGPFKDVTIIYTGGITLDTLKEAVRKDPKGVFCASALTKHINNPEKLKADIKRWKDMLKPRAPEKIVLPPEKPRERILESKVVTFGEMLMRLSPPGGIRLAQASNFELNLGGAEANVAVALAGFGIPASYVTVLPDNALGNNAFLTLRSYGVDTQFIIRRGNRMGIYYLEQGSGQRPSTVVYDRAYSAFSEIEPRDLDWEAVFKNAQWFHWTGITPALGDSVVATLRMALEVAKKKKITVSADLNYRKKLWKDEKAKEVMEKLMPFVDILIGNEEDPIRVFGIKPKGTDVTEGKLDIEGYRKLAEALIERFGFKKVAITLRESISASENYWSACLFDGKNFYKSPRYYIWIIDRVGTGDAFAAGLIYSILKGKADQEALSFGVAAACLKHSISGDFTSVSVQEVERLVAGEQSGRVQR
ncbi:MAG: aldolase [Candidatus Aminicenantes bacterium]|nr:MAG: aldolase [Candidatus Aminicenantes bacterium]